jgi:short-subunit dehydrogenase
MYIPGISAYSSTKYALNAISLIARQELAKDNIIVSIIEPNITATNFAQNSIGARPGWNDHGGQMHKIDPPEKVAEAIVHIIKSGEAELRVE